VKAFTEILQVEEKADRASRDKVRTVKRDIPEGSEEFDILQKKYYAEELKSTGLNTPVATAATKNLHQICGAGGSACLAERSSAAPTAPRD